MHILHYNITSDSIIDIGEYYKIYFGRKIIFVNISFNDFRASKCIMFRSRIQFRVPILHEQYWQDVIVSLDTPLTTNHNLKITDLMRNEDIAKSAYGDRYCYDPRMFGVCNIRSGVYRVHEIMDKTDNVCMYCNKPFPNLIPPVVCGRVIWHLSSI